MPPVSPAQVINDPDFQALSDADRHKFFMAADPDYASLAPGDQTKFLEALRLNQSATGNIHAPWDLGNGPLPSSAPQAPWDYGQTPAPRSESDTPGKVRPFTLDRPATDSLVNQPTFVPPSGSEVGALYDNANTAGDVVQGGIKKVDRAALTLSPLIRKIPKVGAALVPSAPNYNPSADPVEGAKEMMQNKNTAEALGGIGTTAAEYMLPGLGEEVLTENLAARGIPKLLSRALYGGATNAGIEALNGGSGKDVGIAAGVGGALPVASKYLVEPVVNRIRREAPRLMQSALDVAPKEFRYGRNPAQGVTDEGISAKNPEDLYQQVKSRYVQRAQEVEQHLQQNAHQPMDLTKSVMAPIEKAQNLAADNGNEAAYNQLETIKQRLSQKHQMFRMSPNEPPIHFYSGEVPGPTVTARFRNFNTGPIDFTDFTPAEANAFKMRVGDMAKWTPQELTNPDAQLVNNALRQVYHNVNNDIETAAPGTKALNNRVGELMSAKHALEIGGQKDLAAGSRIPDALKRVIRRGALIGSLGALGGEYGEHYDKANVGRDALLGAAVGGLGDLAAEPVLAKMEDPAFLSRFAQFTHTFPSANRIIRPFGAAAMTAYDEGVRTAPDNASHIVYDANHNVIGHIVDGNFVRSYASSKDQQ